jgi:hypothetical protein
MKNKKPKSAFTFIELSIVLILISATIFLVTVGGKQVISSARLMRARSITANSGIGEIPGMVLWLDAVAKNAFITSERDSTSIKAISTWYDQNPQSDTKNNALWPDSSSGVTYVYDGSNGIKGLNNLPALAFTTSSYLVVNANNKPSFDLPTFSIFIVAASISGSYTPSGAYIAKDHSFAGGTLKRKLEFGPNHFSAGDDTSVINFSGTPSDYTATSIRAFISSSNTSHKYWVNNVVTSVTTTLYNDTFNQAPLQIGTPFWGGVNSSEDFTGIIGEIIIYNRALSDVEAKEVINYLGDKWGISFY